MPDDQDRVLAQLAVEAGFLTREEASHYWQRLQAPGSPRLVQLLMHEGRLTQAQMEQLRLRYMSMRQLESAVVAAAPAIIDEEGGGGQANETSLEPPPVGDASTVLDGPAAPRSPGGDSWEESLQKDALLARVLLERRATSLDRLQECRQLQVQHRIRLGVVLVKKGYVERGVVEQAVASVLAQLGGQPARSASVYQAAETQLDGPGGLQARFPVQDDQGTLLEGPMDNVDTVLNSPAVAPAKTQQKFDPFDTAPTGGSIEELNPFALADLKPRLTARSDEDIPLPGQRRKPVPSAGELDPLGETALPPPPSPGALEPNDAQSPRHGLPPAPPMASRNSGFTPTGMPVGGVVETGSTRLKAREKASLKRNKARKRAKKKGSNFSLLVILMLVGGLVIAGGLYALIVKMPF